VSNIGVNPLFPASGLATCSLNGLNPKSKFLAFGTRPAVVKINHRPSMNHLTTRMLAITLLAGVASASAADVASSKFESKFYKDFPLFSTYPKEANVRTEIEHFGPVGIGINLLLPPFQMQVSRLEKGSPAEATGKIKVGQMIESINGEKLKDIDPRIQLGAVITKAEATDGVIKFMLKETPEAKAEEVIVRIPVLGAYSKTWPLNCPKSDKIVRGEAEYLARTRANGLGLGLLFLLSTGEEKDLEVVRGWVQAEVAKQKDAKDLNTIPWRSGYGGIGLCEYYLRTGDSTVIPLIEKHADYLKRNMYNGGWNQMGGVNYSYGHLNAAGIPAATFLLHAKECGAQVDHQRRRQDPVALLLRELQSGLERRGPEIQSAGRPLRPLAARNPAAGTIGSPQKNETVGWRATTEKQGIGMTKRMNVIPGRSKVGIGMRSLLLFASNLGIALALEYPGIAPGREQGSLAEGRAVLHESTRWPPVPVFLG